MTSLHPKYSLPPTMMVDQRTGAVCIPDVIYPETINITATHKGPTQVTLTFYAAPQYTDFPPVMARTEATHRIKQTPGGVVITPVEEDVTEAEFDQMMAEGTPVEIVTDRDISTLR